MKNFIKKIIALFYTPRPDVPYVYDATMDIQEYLLDVDFKINDDTLREILSMLNQDAAGTVSVKNINGELVTINVHTPKIVFKKYLSKKGCIKRGTDERLVKPLTYRFTGL